MKFKTTLAILSNLYKFLEKFNLEKNLEIDYLIENNYPEFASRLQSYAGISKIAICATNGKKTITNILNQIIKANENTLFTNLSSNAKRYPVLTSLVLELGLNPYFDIKEDKNDYYVMALDEFELSNYFNSMRFDYLLLNNLFSDQRDFSSLEDKKKKIQEAIILNSKLNLIINADEPMFFQIDEIKNDAILNKKRTKFYYGFNSIEFAGSNQDITQRNDILKCPICGCKLDYKKRYYSHLGQYDCECGFKRPKLDLSANAKVFNDYTFLEVMYQENKLVFKLPFGGVYNAYNALGAIATAFCLNINRKTISCAFENYKEIEARDEIIEYKNKKIKIKVLKNSTSLSEAIGELYGAKNLKVVFAFCDSVEDGIDTSWIWDSNFKALKGFENKIYVCANRFDDMALRLKYSDINPCLISMDSSIKSTIECCYYELEENETMLVLTVPSLIDEIYELIKR